jgi:hypothetical protein
VDRRTESKLNGSGCVAQARLVLVCLTIKVVFTKLSGCHLGCDFQAIITMHGLQLYNI